MLRASVAVLVATVSVVSVAAAQRSPYAGREAQAIKALTPDEIRAYLAGEGMGFALPAELNGYPGPRHVLELADSLGLTPERRTRVQEIYDEMHAAAVRLGESVVAAEAGLDSSFASGRASATDLETRLTQIADLQGQIADLQGQLRFVHLSAHLRMMTVLSREQIEAYQRLRGYAGGHEHRH